MIGVLSDAAMMATFGAGDTPIGPLISAVAIVAGLVLIYAIFARRRGRLGPAAKAGPRESDAAARQQDELRRDIERLMVELNNLAQQIGTRLADQQRRLEEVMADAERRIAEVQSLMEPPPRTERPQQPADTLAVPAAHRAVYELIDRGMSPTEVAQRTGRPIGEIELILNLRRSG